MTSQLDTVVVPVDMEGRRPDRRPRLAALIGAVTLVVVVTILILTLGYRPVPTFPTAADEPDPARSGTIAVVTAEERGWCLVTVQPADGHRTELRCESGWPAIDEVAWTTAGNLALLGYGDGGIAEPVPTEETPLYPGREVRIVDPDSGEDLRVGIVVGREVPRWPLGSDRRDDGARVRVDTPERGTATVRVTSADGTTRVRLDVEGPFDYAFEGAAWSPDGTWILLLDNRQRLLVMPAEGTSPPVVVLRLGRDQWLIAPPAWSQPGIDGELLDESTITP